MVIEKVKLMMIKRYRNSGSKNVKATKDFRKVIEENKRCVGIKGE